LGTVPVCSDPDLTEGGFGVEEISSGEKKILITEHVPKGLTYRGGEKSAEKWSISVSAEFYIDWVSEKEGNIRGHRTPTIQLQLTKRVVGGRRDQGVDLRNLFSRAENRRVWKDNKTLVAEESRREIWTAPAIVRTIDNT